MNDMETTTLNQREAEVESVRKELQDEVAQQIDEKNKLKKDLDVKLRQVQSLQDQITLLKEELRSQKEEARQEATASAVEADLTFADFAHRRDEIVQKFLLTEEFKCKFEEAVKKFRASEEFKQERLTLMMAGGDQIQDKIHRKRPEFNTNILNEESDDGCW